MRGREPLFRIMHKLRKMPASDRPVYLMACIKCEAEGSSRRRELHKALIDARTTQIRHEMGRLL
jgi:hypothetical protein